MLRIDNQSGYGKLAGGDFAYQDEIQVLRIIYAAACDTTTIGGFPNPTVAKLKASLMSAQQGGVRLLSDIHISPLDQRPHLTLLFPPPPGEGTIIHIVAKFNQRSYRWEYLRTDPAQATTRPRNFVNGKDYSWARLESYGNM